MTVMIEKGGLIEIEEKALSETDDVITITGYGSTFGNLDHGNDIVMPGAFAESLKTIGMPLLLWQHKMDEPPIGSIVEAKEDSKGLWIKAELPKDDALVRDRIGKQLKRRAIKSMSIGYKTVRSERRKSDNARLLRQLKLFEISLVNMPMNPAATVDTVKGYVCFQDLPLVREVEAWDPAAALARIKARFADSDEARRAFLLVDEQKAITEWDTRLLIADVDANGELYANPIAVFKAAAAVLDERAPLGLGDEALEALKEHVDRYYGRLNLESPTKELSNDEFEALTTREREARLKGLGLSNALSKRIASGQWDADQPPRRDDAGLTGASELLSALTSIGKAAESLMTKART